MADTRTRPAAAALTGNEVLPLDQSNGFVHLGLSALRTWINASAPAPSATGAIAPAFRPNTFYDLMPSTYSDGDVFGAGQMMFEPMWLEQNVTIAELGGVVTLGVAASSAHLAIYANDPATQRPTGNPLAAAIIDAATGGEKTVALTAPVTLTGGNLYWRASISEGAIRMRRPAMTLGVARTGSQIIGGTTTGTLRANSQTPGTWPTMSTATAGSMSPSGDQRFNPKIKTAA